MPLNVLIIGAGLTSAVLSKLLKQRFKNTIRLVIWEQHDYIGGRMFTRKSSGIDSCIANVGAQYVTTTEGSIRNHKLHYDPLIKKGLLEPLNANVEGFTTFPTGTSHYVAPSGMKSLVEHFLMYDDIKYQCKVLQILEKNGTFEVASSDHSEIFHVVILTMPLPVCTEIDGVLKSLIRSNSSLRQNVESVKYSERFAVVLFYDKVVDLNIDWDVKFVKDDPIIRYISVDNRLRNKPEDPTSVVFHSTRDFGEKYIEYPIADIMEQFVNYIQIVFPEWPQPVTVKCHKFKYSQVVKPYSDDAGYLVFNENPLLVATGDSFTTSDFDGCLTAAMKTYDFLRLNMKP